MFVIRNSLRYCHTLVDFKRYPLYNRDFVRECREEFHRTGCLYLSKFLTNETLEKILEEIHGILQDSSKNLYQSYVQHTENLYETTTTTKSINETESSSKTIIAYDQIPSTSLLRQLYSWSNLIEYIRDVIDIYPQLYPSCDPYGALYINIYRQSNQLNWHTDHSHFFLNLLLEQPTNEGIFQYKTFDQSSIINRNDFQAGGLVLFNGRQYSHRVTPILSEKSRRINAILTYDCTPNHNLSDYVREKFFGRK